jgi:hypothetical protein
MGEPRHALRQCVHNRSVLFHRLTGGYIPTVTARLHCWATLTPDTVQDKAVHGRIQVVDTHINLPIVRTTERSWR